MTGAPAPRAISAIRYMGNKSALAGWIADVVTREADGALVVDPMAGSHAITQALKARHPLIASDSQAYSAVLGRAFVDNCDMPRVPDDVVARLESAAREACENGSRGWFEENLADTYFGAEQCRQLDALRQAIDDVLPDDGPMRALAIAATMHAACRAQASTGHFAQFLPPAHPRTLALRRVDVLGVALEALRSWDVTPGCGARSRSLPWRALIDAEDGTLADAGAWYLDPPYTADQYSRFYHVLETIALGDRPATRHKARYRDDRFRSGFCSRRQAPAELAELLAAIRGVSPRASVILSYSSLGIMTFDTLVDASRGAFTLGETSDVAHAYSTQGKGVLHGAREWLLTLRPN